MDYNMNTRWVSVDEVAQHLGIARDTVYRWIEKKGLPAHRVGKLWKFQLSEIDEWVKSNGTGPPNSQFSDYNEDVTLDRKVGVTQRGKR
jgi:excisionase family DNA binding protein